MWKHVLVGIVAVILASYLGCQSTPNTPDTSAPSTDDGSRGTFTLDCSTSTTCGTEACIEAWFDDYCLDHTLTIEPGDYDFQRKFTFNSGECKIYGESSLNPPVLLWDSQTGIGEAVVWFQEDIRGNYTHLRDLDFDFSLGQNDQYLMQFKACHVKLERIDISSTNCGYVWFRLIDELQIDNITVSSGICTLLADPNCPGGSMIKNSELKGVFDINATGGSGNTVTFRNNDIYDLRLRGSTPNTVNLARNVFPSTAETAVLVHGYFTVNADSNETKQDTGSCKCNALKDFDVGANATLNLDSWKYDGIYYGDPTISNVQSQRVDNTVTVTWNTPGPTKSTVEWGYSSGAMTNSANGNYSANHSVVFFVAGDEGCVYLQAISSSLDDSCKVDNDTSDVYTNVKDVAISNINATFSALLCEFTVTWTTNVKSSSKVYYGDSCLNLNHTATGTGDTTSHSVVCDVSTVSGARFSFKVESATSCDTGQSACQSERKGKCIGEP